MSVSDPRPGPISTTVSCGSSATASAIRARIRLSDRKCWPRLFRTGGSALASRRGTSAPEHDDGEVVSSRRIARMLIEQLEDAIHDLGGVLVANAPRDLHDLLLAEAIALPIARVAHAVGEQQQHVARRPWPAYAAWPGVAHPE